jgi:eukaryotic-like serine/threonine-protein kinase
MKMGSWYEDDALLDHYLERLGASSGAAPQVPGYAQIRLVSTGGQGVVYSALRLCDGRAVALKLFSRRGFQWKLGEDRLAHEAASLARLDHPGIVRFYELLEDAQGRAVLAMEWMDGGSLSEQLPFGPRSMRYPTLTSWVGCVLQIAEAVQAAHQAGVFHRDLKPSNVLLGAGNRPKVADFGIGLGPIDREDRLTRSGVVLGSLAYAAPEQLEPASATTQQLSKQGLAATDVYGLGCILYEGLTGSPPHALRGVARLAIPPPPSTVRKPSWDPRLEGITLKALAAKPVQRYSSAAEFAADLRSWLNGERIRATSFGPLQLLGWHLRNGLRPRRLRRGPS